MAQIVNIKILTVHFGTVKMIDYIIKKNLKIKKK